MADVDMPAPIRADYSDPLINLIRETHRQRQDLVRAQGRLTNQIEAIHRRLAGGLKKDERDRILKKASNREDHACADTLPQRVNPDDDTAPGEGDLQSPVIPRAAVPLADRCRADPAFLAAQMRRAALQTQPLTIARDVLEGKGRYEVSDGKRRYVPPERGFSADLERELARLAKDLPVWPWVATVKGFGAVGLAQIVAESGDLSNYAGPARLWKRLGLAVIDGERQRKCADVNLALIHGYSPQRRSIVYVLADSLMKQNGDGECRTYYLAEKERQRELHPDDRPIVHHNRALRHMSKRLLRDLWRAWRASAREGGDAGQTAA